MQTSGTFKSVTSTAFELSGSQLRFVGLLAAVMTLLICVQFIQLHASQARTSDFRQTVTDSVTPAFTGVFQIDPNTSPADSLELLPGIGPVLAERMVAYRQEKRFETVEDLRKVPGIGAKTVERLKPYLVIGEQ
jgi:competence ComEA-like helix-hairpin-helix protein